MTVSGMKPLSVGLYKCTCLSLPIPGAGNAKLAKNVPFLSKLPLEKVLSDKAKGPDSPLSPTKVIVTVSGEHGKSQPACGSFLVNNVTR